MKHQNHTLALVLKNDHRRLKIRTVESKKHAGRAKRNEIARNDIEDDICLPGRIEHGEPTAIGVCPYCDAQLEDDEDIF